MEKADSWIGESVEDASEFVFPVDPDDNQNELEAAGGYVPFRVFVEKPNSMLPPTNPPAGNRTLGGAVRQLINQIHSNRIQPRKPHASTATTAQQKDQPALNEGAPTDQPHRWEEKKRKAVKWSVEEDQRFYEGLRQFGTDFNLIQVLFPRRRREDILLKFKREEKLHSQEVISALNNEQPIDLELFEVYKEEGNKIQLAEQTTELTAAQEEMLQALERGPTGGAQEKVVTKKGAKATARLELDDIPLTERFKGILEEVEEEEPKAAKSKKDRKRSRAVMEASNQPTLDSPHSPKSVVSNGTKKSKRQDSKKPREENTAPDEVDMENEARGIQPLKQSAISAPMVAQRKPRAKQSKKKAENEKSETVQTFVEEAFDTFDVEDVPLDELYGEEKTALTKQQKPPHKAAGKKPESNAKVDVKVKSQPAAKKSESIAPGIINADNLSQSYYSDSQYELKSSYGLVSDNDPFDE